MSSKRVFQITIGVVVALAAVLAVQPFAKAKVISSSPLPYSESRAQARLEYELGERYGQTPLTLVQISAERAAREYELGERYGVVPLPADREYFLGERYGATPANADREYLLGERYGVTP